MDSEYLSLFGETKPAELPKRKLNQMAVDKHAKLLKLYGEVNQECGDCIHLKRFRRVERWAKCEKSGPTGSNASDWRTHWKACGAFQEVQHK